MKPTRFERMRERLNAVSPSFCLAKWQQVNLQLQTGQTHSCHHPPQHSIDAAALKDNPSALHNTSKKMAARAQMLKGERPTECEYCWNMEDIGEISDRSRKSARDWAEPHFADVVSSGLGERKSPSYLEVAFDSACNLKCAYCSPSNSTSWLQEIKRFGAYPTAGRFNDLAGLSAQGAMPLPAGEPNPFVDAFWEWWPEVSVGLDAFRITGGEPLLSPHTWKFLDRVIESPLPRMDFVVNSNLAVDGALAEKLADRLNRLYGKVKSVKMYVSMDTFGAQAEYIRFGLNYEEFLENCRRVLRGVENGFSFHFMMTVTALSVTGLRRFMEDVRALKNEFPRHEILADASYLRHPSFMAVRILPLEFTNYFDDALAYMQANGFEEAEVESVRRILQWMKLSRLSPADLKQDRSDFFKMFTEYDRRRETSFAVTFPEFVDFWRECETAATPAPE